MPCNTSSSASRRRGRRRSPIMMMLLMMMKPIGLLILVPLGCPQSFASAASFSPSSSSLAATSPFQVLGDWLDRNEESDLKGAGARNIERALKVVASSQQALKTMDGAAHGLYAYSHVRPPVKAWSRLEYSRATKAEKEARLKAFRKAKLLEEAVYSAELAELTADGIELGDSMRYVQELQNKQEVLLEDFASIEGGKFRFILLADPGSERLTLSVGDAVDWDEKLDIIRARPLSVRLRSRGLLQRSMEVNPRLWAAATAILEKLHPVLAVALKKTYPNYGLHITGFSLGAGVAALVGGVLEGAIPVHLSHLVASPPPPPSSSFPAGPAASTASSGRTIEDEGKGRGESQPDKTARPRGVTGMMRDSVTTFLFAPPPCISKGIRGLHRFTTSFVLGDDMVPRATAGSLERLEKRLLDYVSENGGGGIYFDYARSWMKGVVGATLQQMVTHQVTKKEDDEDESSLTLPGRVYYIKPRKLHGGATIKEVLRGNLREDILWQIHEIFVSKSMLKHHSLDKYISVMSRVPCN